MTGKEPQVTGHLPIPVTTHHSPGPLFRQRCPPISVLAIDFSHRLGIEKSLIPHPLCPSKLH